LYSPGKKFLTGKPKLALAPRLDVVVTDPSIKAYSSERLRPKSGSPLLSNSFLGQNSGKGRMG
jgi:hypothetical protein